MPSSIVSGYRRTLRRRGDSRADLPDEALALMYAQHIRQRGESFDKFAENQGDSEFASLVRAGYEKGKTFGSIIDAPVQQYYTKKQGYKQGAASVLGSLGMSETEDDLMRSAQKDARKGARVGREIFDDLEMIDDFGDLVKYVGQGASRSVVDIAPSLITSIIGKGAGSQIQKTLEKGDKLSGLRSKAKQYLGDNYGGKIGMGAGALGSSSLENTGHVYGDLYEYTKLDPTDEMYLSPIEARALSMFGGGVSGALDSALPLFLIGKLSKSIGRSPAEEGVANLFKSLPDGMVFVAKGAGGEGITEALQEVVQMATVKHHTGEEWTHTDFMRMVNGGILGAIGGGTITAATGGVSKLLSGSSSPAIEDGESDLENPTLEETTDERIAIGNRREEKQLLRLTEEGVGTMVSPVGSKRLARVLEVDQTTRTAIIEYPGGNTQKVKVSELSIVDGKKKVLKPEELKGLSDEKLEDLKKIRPNLLKAIEAEQSSREEEVDDGKIVTQSTQLEVTTTKGGQLLVSDISSREQVYSATIREENGVLYVENEAIDAPTDQRKKESQDILYRQARRKAKEDGLILSIGGTTEYYLDQAEINGMDLNDILNAWGKLNVLSGQQEEGSDSLQALQEAYVGLADRMEVEGIVEYNEKGQLATLPVATKQNNSTFLRNNPVIGSALAYKIYTDLESEIKNLTDNYSQVAINEKLILKEAKDIARVLYASEIDGLNSQSDVTSLATAATEKFTSQHLMDDQWKSKTTFDIQSEKDAQVAKENNLKQSAKDNFDKHKPEVGHFVRLDKDDKTKFVKITSVDLENSTIKTEETGDNSISASAIIKTDTIRKYTIGEHRVVESKDGVIKTSLLVTGKDTQGLKKGKKSVELLVTKEGKVTHIDGKEVESDSVLNLDSDELRQDVGITVLDDVKSPPRKEVKKKLAPGVTQTGDTFSATEVPFSQRGMIEKYKVTPDITTDGQVSGMTIDKTRYDFDAPVEAKDWQKAASTKMISEGLFTKKESTPKQTPEELIIEDEKNATASNELKFTNRKKIEIIPSTEKLSLEKEIKGRREAANFIESIELGAGSTASKKAIVLRYFRQGVENPVYLVRSLIGSTAKATDISRGTSILGMGKKTNKKTTNRQISPLSHTTGNLNIDDDTLMESFEEETDVGRLEIVEVLNFQEEARVIANFDTEESYNEALSGTLDYEFIRSKEVKEIDKYLEEAADDDVRANRIKSLVRDEEGQVNPLLEIYAPFLTEGLATQLKADIAERAKNIKGNDEFKNLGSKLGKSEKIRILDLDKFINHIQVGTTKEGVTHGLDVLRKEGDYNPIKKALEDYKNKGGKVQGNERKGVQTVSSSDTLDSIFSSEDLDFRDEIDLNPPKVEEEVEEEVEEATVEESEEGSATNEVNPEAVDFEEGKKELEPTPDEEQFPPPDKQVYEDLLKKAEEYKLDPEDVGMIQTYGNMYMQGAIDIASLVSTSNQYFEQAQARQHESVGEIAYSEEALDREIQKHLDEPRRERIITNPLNQELQQENQVAVEGFLDGLKVDGEPIRLTALLSRMVRSMDGSTNLSGSLLDMAQTLLAHPFAKKLKVEFRSWDNFKHGIQNDGNNGKLTRAYVRGDTIVMGPQFKLQADSDLSATEALQVTFMEEVAHRVFGTAVEAGIKAKRTGKLPRGVSSVMSVKQAIKFYDETKELMDWLRTKTDGKYYHGLLNQHEFWANFATNPEFRKFLNQPLPSQMRRKFGSRFEKVIDWILDLASKLFDTDFTLNRTASDEIRKRYRTLLRTSDKLAANDVDLMPQAKMELGEAQESDQQMESADTLDTDDSASVAQGTLRAHMASLKDFSSVIKGVLAELGDDVGLTPERMKEFITIEGKSTPDLIAKILGKKAKVLVEEAQQRLSESVSPDIKGVVDSANDINDLETRANKDTGARNLINLLKGAKDSVSSLFNEATTSRSEIEAELQTKKERMDALTKPKTMFDAGKTQTIFAKYFKQALYNKSTRREFSNVNAFEVALGLKPSAFSKLRDIKIDDAKLYTLMENLAKGVGNEKFLEQKTSKEIFNIAAIEASDVGINDPSLDQAVQVAVALMLGSDQRNDVPRSAFTSRLRLAPGQVAGTSLQEAVNLIVKASQGRPTPDVKDKSMMSILNNVRQLKEEITKLGESLVKVNEEERVAKVFTDAYNDRLADLDEYLETTAPVELREGGTFETLMIDAKGKIVSDKLIFSLGKGESSNEAKYMAARASELFKIMDTDEYKDQYLGSAKDRYFRHLARELRKPNFGIQYAVSNVGFLHSAASSLQERMARLGPAGKAIAGLLNEYTREYQSESGKIFGQGRKVSGAIKRLHSEMALSSGENLNQFMRNFGTKLFDWFNERPDLQGQEELAINKVWNELKNNDIDRVYTEEGKKALRAYLKQWSIQNENFQRLYRKYDISVLDDDVTRGSIAMGSDEKLYRRFVDQGVFTTPRKLNMTKIAAVVHLLDPMFKHSSDFEAEEGKSSTISFFTSLKDTIDLKEEGVDMNDSFVQSMGKLLNPTLSNLFFKPMFVGKSAHATPFTLTSGVDEGKGVRIVLPEELERAWRNAEGKNPGIKVANAILDIVKLLPNSDEDTLVNLLNQMEHRANALIKAESEARADRRNVGDNDTSLSSMMKGSKLHASIHSRSLYNILPGEFFEYEMYDETSSGQHLSKLMMTAKFGREGEKITDNYQAIINQYEGAYSDYLNLSRELGLYSKEGSMPSRANKWAMASRKKKMQDLIDAKGMGLDFDKLDLEARGFVEAKSAMAALIAAFSSRSSNNQDLTLGLELLRTMAFGMVNTMKGAWTGTMSIPDIGKVLGLSGTMFRTVAGAYGNVAKEMAGTLLESFGIEMIRPDKYASELNDIFGREAAMMSFKENITEIGKQGTLQGAQGGLRKIKNVVNALSTVGSGQRKKTSINFVAGSLLTPLTAPFTYLAQATNKSISLAMANTIERFVLQAVEALDAKGVTLDNNTFEIKPKDLGYEDSKLDSWIFGKIEAIEKLNERLVSENMSFTQLAQDYRRRRVSDPETRVLSGDAVKAAYNISMSEVTYDTMSGKGSWTQSGTGQFTSPLVGWSVSSASKSINQMKNKEGRLAIRESIRYMLLSTAWLLPMGIAFTMFTDWWDEEILGKPSSLRKVPAVAGVPILGLPLAMADPRFDFISMMERSARANNIMGIVQEFASPIIVGQVDPSSSAARFDPTRRVLGISAVMNTVAAATNYLNAIRTSNYDADDFIPDYSNVVRPFMYAMGLNSVIQNAQMATHLTDIEEIDPTGFLSKERQVADITGMRNSLRVYTKVMGMEMRKGGMMTFTATRMGNALKQMERAAYANDKESFKEAWRKALSLSESDDPRADVIEKFKRKHIRKGITRFSITDSDMAAILSVMDDGRKDQLIQSMRNHDFYLKGIGGKPSESNNKKRTNYSEELRRLAL